MNYFVIDARLTEKQAGALIAVSRQRSSEFHQHNNGIDYTHLDILLMEDDHTVNEIVEMFAVKPTAASLMRVPANARIVPHVDGKNYPRKTAVVFPLREVGKKFAPTSFYKDANDSHSYSDSPDVNCYAFSTEVLHGVENTEHDRFSLQLWYDIPIKTLSGMKLI